MRRGSHTVLRTIAIGAVVVGALDLAGARLVSALRGGPGVGRILKSIAAGLLGPEARSGGTGTALLGLALHLCIAGCVVTAYLLASGRWPDLARRPLLWGPPYGALVYFVMYLVVLPLSPGGGGGWLPPERMLPVLLVHLLLVGTPAALIVRGAARPH